VAKSVLYDSLEPKLNAREVELLDLIEVQEQLLTLVVRAGGKIDHQPGDHDDFANAVAGVIWLTVRRGVDEIFQAPIIVRASRSEALGLDEPLRSDEVYGDYLASRGIYGHREW
jgi:hypothetical protein